MSCNRSPWRASAAIVLLISMLAIASRTHAQSGASLGAPVQSVAAEPWEPVPGPPHGPSRNGRAWASVSFVGVTHVTDHWSLSSTTAFFGLYRGPFAFGLMGAVAEGVLLGGQLSGNIAIDERGIAGAGGRLGPRVEILFGEPGSPLFVAADVWLGVSADRDMFGGVAAFGQVGAAMSFGVHVFVTRELSISPFVQLEYARWFDFEVDIVEATLGAMLAGWW